MKRRKEIDPENPPTKRSDWIGAEVLKGGERPRQRRGPVTFYVFRASTDADVFAIAGRDDPTALPACRGGGRWRLFKTLPETGKPRVGFSEMEAKRDIATKGFHLVRVNVGTKATV